MSPYVGRRASNWTSSGEHIILNQQGVFIVRSARYALETTAVGSGMLQAEATIMRILITGATGFIGSHLLQAFVQRKVQDERLAVVAAVRKPDRLRERYPGVSIVALDALHDSNDSLREKLRGVDVVINTIGIISESGSQRFESLHVDFPLRLFRACEQAGVRRVIQLSALGASASARSEYHRSKHTADQFLRSRNLEATIVRPSLVYGRGGASMQFFAALAAQPMQLLMEQGTHQVQPVHIQDVVDTLVHLATMMATPPTEIQVVGPAPVSFRNMLLGYRRWLGFGELRTLSIPWSLALKGARLLGRFSPWLRQDNLLMLQQGNTGDARPVTQLLGREPRALDAVLMPHGATEAERWHARLFLLIPMLRLSVAFVWIYTGLTSLFLYPHADSYAMLAQLGLTGPIAMLALYGAALLDIALGVCILLRWRVIACGLVQLAVIAGYTLLISVFLPEFWLHPFGPISKNIPFMVAILILMAVEKK